MWSMSQKLLFIYNYVQQGDRTDMYIHVIELIVSILWDCEGCGPTNACCSFNRDLSIKDLTSLTTDDIEMRFCQPRSTEGGSTPIKIVELYVL